MLDKILSIFGNDSDPTNAQDSQKKNLIIITIALVTILFFLMMIFSDDNNKKKEDIGDFKIVNEEKMAKTKWVGEAAVDISQSKKDVEKIKNDNQQLRKQINEMKKMIVDIKQNIKNILFHINHVTVPEVMKELIDSRDEHIDSYNNRIDAFLGPSHVSVITGSKIYEIFPKNYNRPVVVAGFEPVDVMEGILMMIRQFVEDRCEVEIQYKRSVTRVGNLKAQELIERYFEKRELFKWRGLGNIPQSAWKLKEEFKLG